MKAIIYNSLTCKQESLDIKEVSNPLGELKEPKNINYLNSYDTKFIITAQGIVYASNDTPGYCDGEKRVISFIS